MIKYILLLLVCSISVYADSWHCGKVEERNICHIYLGQEIGFAGQYTELGNLLDSLGENDFAIFHLKGFGGYVDGLTFLVNKIKASDAHVHTIVEGNVASAHAILALSGDTVSILPEGWFLFHASSDTNTAKYNCLNQLVKLDRGKWAYPVCVEVSNRMVRVDNSLMSRIAKRVLTQKEITDLLNGGTIVLSNKEVKERLGDDQL